jgi:DNA-binding protein HU-beta
MRMPQAVTIYTGDITRAVAREEMLPQTLVTKVFAATLKEIQRELSRGRKVQLTGFGTFYKTARKPSKVKHVKTGKLIEVPAMSLARFTAGADLKHAVRRKR